MQSSLSELPFAADTKTVHDLVLRVADAPAVAIDTEFVRERTYFPELCVLQIATTDFVVAVDCQAEVDLDPLMHAMLDNERPWVLHSARQDLEVLFNRFGRLPSRLVDTQLAAALLGYPLQIGLQGMLADVLGIAIGKEHTRADWSRRPLPAEVLQYALDDVRYLLPAWEELRRRLENSQRLDWFAEDCRRLLETPIQPGPAAILERTKGAGGLRGRQRGAALALVAWREQRAIERNKPRRWILTDEQLVTIATALPTDGDTLRRLPGLPDKLVTRSGQAILAAIDSAPSDPGPPDAEPPDRAVVKSLQAAVRVLADELGVQPELLAARKDIALAAQGRPPAAFTQGWRAGVLAPLAERLNSDRAS